LENVKNFSMRTYTCRKASRKYAKRVQRDRAARQLSNNTPVSGSERKRKYREPKKLEAELRAADGTSISATAAHEPMDVNGVSDYATASENRLGKVGVDFRRSVTMEGHRRSASEHLENTFVNNTLGHECDVFLRDLKPVN
jgi:hypothetical protein